MKKNLNIRLLASGESEHTIHEAALVPASTDKGSKWDITILSFGRSSRPPHFVYTKEAADKSLSVFKGAKVYALRNTDDFGHSSNPASKSTRDIVGVITEARTTPTELKGNLVLLPSASWLKDNLVFAESNNLPAPYELSIDAGGIAVPGKFEGKDAVIVESFKHVSIDVVDQGAAGGKIVKMVASQNTHQHQGDTPMKYKLLALFSLLYPTFLEAKKVDLPLVNENELYTHLLEADKAMPRMHLPDGDKPDEKAIDAALAAVRESYGRETEVGKKLTELMKESKAADDKKPDVKKDTKIELDAETQKRLTEAEKQLHDMKVQGCAMMLESKLQEGQIPIPLRDQVRKQFTGRIFESKEIDEAIKGLREAVSKMMESIPNNLGMDVRVGVEDVDKVKLGILGFFVDDPNASGKAKLTEAAKKDLLKGVPAFRSIREAYIQFTGDSGITGFKRNLRFSESLATGDWSQVVADALNKRMVMEYNMLDLNTWRNIVNVIPLKDFKTQHRIRFGGYPNLPIRGQGAPYMPLTSPGSEEATYVPATRGGTEDLTRELIMNDDVGAARAIPVRMARAAAQTLHEFVYDLVKPSNNPTIYDGSALYIANPHANYGTAALDAAGLAAARLRMKKQTNKDNSKRLGLRLGYVLVPGDLEATAYQLLTPAYGRANTTPEFLQVQSIVPIVIDYWTDATDWAAVARREDIVNLEVGFINGQEDPELFVSDLANVGSWFTNDKITYKIRHEYGAAIIDFRGLDGSVVAG